MKKLKVLLMLLSIFSITNIYGNNGLVPSIKKSGKSFYNNAPSSYFSVHFGPTFPLGDFGGDDINNWLFFNSPNLQSSHTQQGLASIGINLGVQYKLRLPLDGLGITFSGDLFFNGLKKCVKDDFYNHIEDIGNTIKSKYRYYNLPLLIGINYQYNFSNYFGAYIEGGLGLDIRYISKFKIENNHVNYNFTIKPDWAFNFAGETGLGLIYNDLITLGAHFYFLGSKKVSLKENSNDSPNTINKDTAYPLKSNLFTIQIGIRL